MKFFFVKIFLLLILIGASNANENIRFININYIVNNSEAGKNLNKIIENKSKKISSELKDLGNKIENKKDKIISQKNILKKEELDENLKEFKKMFESYNNKRNESRNKIIKEKNKYTSEILNILNPILTKYVEQNNIVLVIEKKNILVGAKVLDITEQVLEVFNNATKNQILSNEN